jgi:hypothetical protein
MSRMLARISPLIGDLFLLEEVSMPVDPGYGRPGGGPRPDQGLPWAPARPDHGLPGFPPYVSGGPIYPGGHPDHGLPGAPGHPGNALPIPPVRPSPPIVLPPGIWPPTLPPGVDNTLPVPPPGTVAPPIVIPPDPSIGIEQPIYLPPLPEGVALLIALSQAQPKGDLPPGHPLPPSPPNTKPAILVQSGKKPVLVYVTAATPPK